jgi:hypothetical protein
MYEFILQHAVSALPREDGVNAWSTRLRRQQKRTVHQSCGAQAL